MALWNQSSMLPEEQVRSSLVAYMVRMLGYPRELISLEKEIALLPHLSHLPKKTIPKRRVDILVFSKNMEPLLMVECKAGFLHTEHRKQLLSYNTFVCAPFIALVNGDEQWFAERGSLTFQEGFMSYAEVLRATDSTI